MSRKDLVNKIARTNPQPDFDCFEEVAFFFDNDQGEKGAWCWQYSLYSLNTRELLMRRIGNLSLQNPKVGAAHLRRALIQDQKLGAFIPQPEEWSAAGAGESAGYVFTQKQRRSRANHIAEKAGEA